MPAAQPKPEWYIATLVMKITVERETQNVVHRNLVLVSATTAEQAYKKAMRFDRRSETVYDNPAGQRVEHVFRGIAQLDTLIDGELADGAELTFEEHKGMSEEQIQTWVCPKEMLWAFRTPDIHSEKAPDYRSAEVLRRVKMRSSQSHPEESPGRK